MRMPSLKRACLSPDCCCCCPVQDHPCPDAPANMLSHHIGRLNTPQTTMARPMIELGPTTLITLSYVNVKLATPFASATMLPRSPRCLPCHQPCSAPYRIVPYRAADSGPPCVMFSGLKWPPALAPPDGKDGQHISVTTGHRTLRHVAVYVHMQSVRTRRQSRQQATVCHRGTASSVA